ncbi:T-cell activation Rho GTPase-activating protein-like isoform X1 [Pezoporus flaviventris]|uniref:T-cell activation Rho GTPase-activating protein-like isoform X1 n=1 Tax=Pezoporus flaviventris TaxID=889875 RepID=UPI002AB0B0C0|nr:T-cell activation Rho GTPase-activating protein-like isoform X1 [Pezoporus flaviventris]
MTAGNLAICLAPNLLSPPQELPLDILALETGKVTQLVEFLIDHHEELLGEQVAGLAREEDEEAPAAQAELETAEVSEVHEQHDSKSLPNQKVGLLPPQEQAWSSTSLQLCQSAEQGRCRLAIPLCEVIPPQVAHLS